MSSRQLSAARSVAQKDALLVTADFPAVAGGAFAMGFGKWLLDHLKPDLGLAIGINFDLGTKPPVVKISVNFRPGKKIRTPCHCKVWSRVMPSSEGM